MKSTADDNESLSPSVVTQGESEAEGLFREMADSSPVMLWMAQEDGRCTFFNETWLRFTGRGFEQELGYGWAEGVHPQDFQKCIDTYYSSVSARKPFAMEYRLKNKEGEYRWLLDQGAPRFNTRGVFLGYVGSCTDIHDRRILEQERELLLTSELKARNQAERLHQRAEEVNRIKDEFLAAVSHELRTPLNAILGWGELILSGDIMGSELQTAVQNIINNAKSQLRLVDDLVDISQISYGKMNLNLKKSRFSNILALALKSLAFTVKNKNIRLEVTEEYEDPNNPPSAEHDLIVCDPDRIQQVIWNVLSNAIKFTPAEGNIKITWKREGDNIEFAITDTGQGIAPDFLPYVFERFRQESAGTTRTFSGLGLGLAISKNLIELHGGHIEAFSAGHTQGATFKFSLPVLVKEIPAIQNGKGHLTMVSPSQTTAIKKSNLFENLKILIVDDQEEFLVIMKRILESFSAAVLQATNVPDALQLVEENHPDLIVSDISMPKEDGYDFIRKLKLILPSRGWKIPVMALTAHSSAEDIEHAIALGFNMHLAKPVERKHFIKSISTLVGRRDEYDKECEK